MKNLLVKKCLQAIALFGLFFIFIKPIYAEGVFYFLEHEKDYDDVKVDIENNFAAVIMGTPLVWLNSFASNALGLTGEGQIIRIADTGISTGNLDKIHPDLKGKIIDVKDYRGDGAKDLPNEPRVAQGFGLIDLQASIVSLEDTMTIFFD